MTPTPTTPIDREALLDPAPHPITPKTPAEVLAWAEKARGFYSSHPYLDWIIALLSTPAEAQDSAKLREAFLDGLGWFHPYSHQEGKEAWEKYSSESPISTPAATVTEEDVARVANGLRAVMERPDNWGITPYDMLARAAIAAMRQPVKEPA